MPLILVLNMYMYLKLYEQSIIEICINFTEACNFQKIYFGKMLLSFNRFHYKFILYFYTSI